MRIGPSHLLWSFLGSLWRGTQLSSSGTSCSHSCTAERHPREDTLKSTSPDFSAPWSPTRLGTGGSVLRIKNLPQERQRQGERNPGPREEREAMSCCNKRIWWRTNPGSHLLSLNSCTVLGRLLNLTGVWGTGLRMRDRAHKVTSHS